MEKFFKTIVSQVPNRIKLAFLQSSFIIFIGTCVLSCAQFLDVEPSNVRVTSNNVFSENATAIAAISGVYHDMINSTQVFSSGGVWSVVSLCGMSADELQKFNDDVVFLSFEENTLNPDHSFLSLLWNSMYKTIYQANAVYEGVSNSSSLTPELSVQLRGEALFLKAFAHFYLVNLFGNVPLVISSDYVQNSSISRTPVDVVYSQIETDLNVAIDLLSDEFISGERVRVNKSAAIALLARVYLYTGQWQLAETESSKIINNTVRYNLVTSMAEVFYANSKEAIWQLKPTIAGINTHEGEHFIVSGSPGYVLNEDFVNTIEAGDNRLNWIGSFDLGSEVVYFPYKYKFRQGDPLTEYSMVLRLAEQYLIRAESRAQLNDLSGAISDLNVIRGRAGLALIQDTNPGISQSDLLHAIEQERRIEFFAEWGHRWLDLKRTGRANDVLGAFKNSWEPSDQLYPIPQLEINNNSKLKQNPGY